MHTRALCGDCEHSMEGRLESMGLSGILSAPDTQRSKARKRIFLVRHGQALHNVLEERVKAQASREAELLGYSRGSQVFDEFVKEARLAALSDEGLRDAALSDLGQAQLLRTRAEIDHHTMVAKQTQRPTLVFVSPLLRTLQSAAVLFPNHANVHTCKLLCERRTGLPCDTCRQQSEVLAKFPQIDFNDAICSERCLNGVVCEDAAALRKRSAAFMEALRTIHDESICVVSHKGFLRELQRGPLGHVEAEEFKPGEVRVFDVTFHLDGHFDAAELGATKATGSSSIATRSRRLRAPSSCIRALAISAVMLAVMRHTCSVNVQVADHSRTCAGPPGPTTWPGRGQGCSHSFQGVPAAAWTVGGRSSALDLQFVDPRKSWLAAPSGSELGGTTALFSTVASPLAPGANASFAGWCFNDCPGEICPLRADLYGFL